MVANMKLQTNLRLAQAGRLVALMCLLLPVSIMAAEIWVVTDQHHAVRGEVDRLIKLDAPQLIEDELSADLPRDGRVAAVVIHQRIEQGGLPLQQQIRMAHQGVIDAWHLGVTALPAIVVDQRYVVYGEHEVDRALVQIARYRRVQP